MLPVIKIHDRNMSVTSLELALNRDEVQILLYYIFSVKMNNMFLVSSQE